MLRASGPKIAFPPGLKGGIPCEEREIDGPVELGLHDCMTSRERWTLALWLAGIAAAVWAVIRFGLELVMAAPGIGGTLLIASPARCLFQRAWALNAEHSNNG